MLESSAIVPSGRPENSAVSQRAVYCVQGEQQLEQVQTAEMNSPDVDDSFARLNYHQDSEIGVNEQIK